MADALHTGLLGEVFKRQKSAQINLDGHEIPGMLSDAKAALKQYNNIPFGTRQNYLTTLTGELNQLRDEVKSKIPDAQNAYNADQSADNAYEVGALYRQMGNCDQAEAWFRKAITHDANHADAHNDLGYCVLHGANLEADKVKEANGLLTKARELASHLPSSNLDVAADHKVYVDKTAAGVPIDYNSQGVLYLKVDKFEEAKTSFEQKIKENSHHAEAYNNLSLCHSYLGNFGPALESAITALELNPKLSPANLIQAALMVKHCIEHANCSK